MIKEYKLGDIVHYKGSVYKVVGFDNEIPFLNETKVKVQFT